MILGLGIDIVEVSRLEKWLNDKKLLERFFNKEELEYVLSKGDGAFLSVCGVKKYSDNAGFCAGCHP